MSIATLVFPHQLYKQHPAIHKDHAAILVEEYLYFSQYQFHQQKLVLHRASMKAYEDSLKKEAIATTYIEAAEKHSDVRKIGTWLKNNKFTEVHFVHLSDDWLHRRLTKALGKVGIAFKIFPSPNFITTEADFDTYMTDKKGYFQTDFYIWQRKRFRILLEKDGTPKGGKWSFDEENRQSFPAKEKVPEVNFPKHSAFVAEAIEYVKKHWPENYGNVENFKYPVTHRQAENWLNDFLLERFVKFGVYEDAMVAQEHYLYHSVLTPMLNIGLLDPKQIVNAAIKTAKEKKVPFNSVEGFIRQIIGWREFIHSVYLKEGRQQRTRNYWLFNRPVPKTFWRGETGILPVDTVIKKVLQTGYSHHIERLMVMGNFMLLCEFDPDEVYRWFMEMYVDAYDWVMVPNTYGMTQFSDDGLMMTKPYISGSNYLLKMGNWAQFEKTLQTDPADLFAEETVDKTAKSKKGKMEDEEPSWKQVWDGLFWRFMHVHQQFFSKNPRLGLLLKAFDKMDKARQKEHLQIAEAFLQKLDQQNKVH